MTDKRQRSIRSRLLAGASILLVALVLAQCSHPPPVTLPEEEAAPPEAPPAKVEEVGPYNILSYSVDVRRNGILIEVLLREPLHYEWFLTDGEWINLTFDGGRLDPNRMHSMKPHAEVLEVVAHQFENSAQLSFRMSSPVEKYRVSTDPYSPKRILVMITGSTRGMIEDLDIRGGISDYRRGESVVYQEEVGKAHPDRVGWAPPTFSR